MQTVFQRGTVSRKHAWTQGDCDSQWQVSVHIFCSQAVRAHALGILSQTPKPDPLCCTLVAEQAPTSPAVMPSSSKGEPFKAATARTRCGVKLPRLRGRAGIAPRAGVHNFNFCVGLYGIFITVRTVYYGNRSSVPGTGSTLNTGTVNIIS